MLATEALFLIMELANNPDIQEKIRNEIKSIAQTDHRNFMPTFEDLNKMKYIDNVIKEALRLHPVAPTLFREAMEDMEINGIQIPKGVTYFYINSSLLCKGSSLVRFTDTPARS